MRKYTPNEKFRGFLAALLLFAIFWFASHSDDNKTAPAPTANVTRSAQEIAASACNAAKDAVKGLLQAPSTADFPDCLWSGDQYSVFLPIKKDFATVKGYVDAQNAFGAKLRSAWTVELQKDGEGDMGLPSWRTLSVTIADKTVKVNQEIVTHEQPKNKELQSTPQCLAAISEATKRITFPSKYGSIVKSGYQCDIEAPSDKFGTNLDYIQGSAYADTSQGHTLTVTWEAYLLKATQDWHVDYLHISDDLAADGEMPSNKNVRRVNAAQDACNSAENAVNEKFKDAEATCWEASFKDAGMAQAEAQGYYDTQENSTFKRKYWTARLKRKGKGVGDITTWQATSIDIK